jgi:basic membrane lipoprotein Med (substrate-binding protein (PBP1-ABC) superfamily)
VKGTFEQIFSTPIHTFVLIAVAACSSGNTAQSATAKSSAQSDSVFKVALLTPGPISDQSWNAGAYAGLRAIADSFKTVTSHIQTKTPADFEENFRHYGTEGFDLVFGHGFEFQDAAGRVAPEYPGTVYVVTSGGRAQPPNVAGVIFGFDNASYVAGVLAGSISRSGVIGVIGGTALPPVENSFRAFESGARSVRPGLRVLTSYVGNWEDASVGRELALAQMRQGADLIFQNADAAGLGIFQAARQATDVYVFGANIDQNRVAPDVIIGSVVIDLPRAFVTIAREVHDGTFTARTIHLGGSSGVVRFVRNPTLAERVPDAIWARVDSVERELRASEAAGSHSTPTSTDTTDAVVR